MTNDIKISRELLGVYLGVIDGDWVEAGHELRAMLAAPVVEPLVVHLTGPKEWLDSHRAAPVVERQEAWMYCPECGCEELHHEQGEHKQCANCHQEWFSDIDYSEVVRGNLEKLKSSPPAPVSVVRKLEMADVVNAHMEIPNCPVMTSNQCHALAMKLNARLDKTKELNQ